MDAPRGIYCLFPCCEAQLGLVSPWDQASVILPPGVSPALPLQTAVPDQISINETKYTKREGEQSAEADPAVGHAATESRLWQIRLKLSYDGKGDTGIIMGHS